MNSIRDLILALRELVSLSIPLVAGLALLAFFWGLMRFIFSAGDEKAQDKGKAVMKWGLIALFVMVSVWGIIGFFQESFGLPVTVDRGGDSGESSGPQRDTDLEEYFQNPNRGSL